MNSNGRNNKKKKKKYKEEKLIILHWMVRSRYGYFARIWLYYAYAYTKTFLWTRRISNMREGMDASIGSESRKGFPHPLPLLLSKPPLSHILALCPSSPPTTFINLWTDSRGHLVSLSPFPLFISLLSRNRTWTIPRYFSDYYCCLRLTSCKCEPHHRWKQFQHYNRLIAQPTRFQTYGIQNQV